MAELAYEAEWLDDDFADQAESITGNRKKETSAELCWEKALQLLARQDYTTMRLKRKLAERFTIEAVQVALAKAAEYGYLNDMNYAQRFINSRKEDKSRQEIRMALRERGLRDCDDLLEELYPLEDEEQVAQNWLGKRYRDSDLLRDKDEQYWKVKRKLCQALLRRGFSYLTIENVLGDFLQDYEE